MPDQRRVQDGQRSAPNGHRVREFGDARSAAGGHRDGVRKQPRDPGRVGVGHIEEHQSRVAGRHTGEEAGHRSGRGTVDWQVVIRRHREQPDRAGSVAALSVRHEVPPGRTEVG